MCDYCSNLSVCRVTVHNYYRDLCLDCAKKNKERLGIKDKDILELEKGLSGLIKVD